MPVGARHIDLGVLASVIIGAVAAVAALWVFPPETTISVTNAETITTSRYDIVKVVGLSLIIGSAGGSFLSAMQARALALVKTQEAATTERVAKRGLADIDEKIQAGATAEALTATVSTTRTAVAAAANSGPGNPNVEDF